MVLFWTHVCLDFLKQPTCPPPFPIFRIHPLVPLFHQSFSLPETESPLILPFFSLSLTPLPSLLPQLKTHGQSSWTSLVHMNTPPVPLWFVPFACSLGKTPTPVRPNPPPPLCLLPPSCLLKTGEKHATRRTGLLWDKDLKSALNGGHFYNCGDVCLNDWPEHKTEWDKFYNFASASQD